MPTGAGTIAYLSDEDENYQTVSTAGRAFFSESYPRVKNHSPINVTAASGGSEFESISVGRVVLRSESGNGIMWWGGTSDDAPFSGHGMPLWGGQKTPYLPVTNFNNLRVVASISGQIIYAIGFLNGSDSILPNTVAQQPPIPPDTTAPLVTAHSPVSGLSGLAFNSEITATFNEEISQTSVTSGSFRLSPAHNVSVFRHVTDENTIVMVPNVNLSGSTVYYVGINSQITDLVGNSVSGTSGGFTFTWPFTTTAAPPPPDVTAPVVSGTNPTSGATNVSGSNNVTITFSEAMLSGSITPLNIYLSYLSGVTAANGISGTVTLSAVDSKTVTIDPTPSTLSGSANVKINMLSGCRDLAGNNLVIDRSRNFTIAVADVTKPTVISTTPADGASNVNVNTSPVVVFSEPMLSGTINTTNLFLSTTLDGSANPASFTVSLSGNKLAAEINPTGSLTPGSYFINVLTGVQDLAGNAMLTADTSRTFSTLYNYQLVYLVTGSGTGDMYDGNDTRLGLVIVGSCDLLGSAPKKIVMRLRKNGSPTGTASITLRKGSDDSIVKTFGTVNVASLTSSYQDFTFTDLTQTYVMVTGDMILVEYSGGSSSNRLEIQRTSSGDAYSGVDYVQYDDSEEYNPDSGKDVAWDIYE